MEEGSVYCRKELVERERDTDGNEEDQIYLGLRDFTKGEEAIKYVIESVRVPKERIAMYARYQMEGPDDISLIKLKEHVVFIPGKIMPVS